MCCRVLFCFVFGQIFISIYKAILFPFVAIYAFGTNQTIANAYYQWGF